MLHIYILHVTFLVLILHRFDRRPSSLCFLLPLLCALYLVAGEESEGESSGAIYNVMNFGAVGNGRTDDTKSFLKAWDLACRDRTSPMTTFLVPSGKTFLLNQIKFNGSCHSSHIHFNVLGNLVAPNRRWKVSHTANWITFRDVRGLSIDGGGIIDGRGSRWWDCVRKKECINAPYGVGIFACKNFQMSGLHFRNSPGKHLSLHAVSGAFINGITVDSPESSPNTDGMHIKESHNIIVNGSSFSTGDDCISIGNGSQDIDITHVKCGPGHGISIGSLGNGDEMIHVQRIHVSHCSFVKTTNGARIKTWEGGYGFAKGIIFEQLIFESVVHPILIDQHYCTGLICPRKEPIKKSAVHVSDIHFIGLTGTSSSHAPITLNCSRIIPCTNIQLKDVNIKGAFGIKTQHSVCRHAHIKQRGTIVPPITCLRPPTTFSPYA